MGREVKLEFLLDTRLAPPRHALTVKAKAYTKAPRPSLHPYPNDRINSASSTEATIKMLPFTAQAQGIRAGASRLMRLLKCRANLMLAGLFCCRLDDRVQEGGGHECGGKM